MVPSAGGEEKATQPTAGGERREGRRKGFALSLSSVVRSSPLGSERSDTRGSCADWHGNGDAGGALCRRNEEARVEKQKGSPDHDLFFVALLRGEARGDAIGERYVFSYGW